MPCRPMDTRKVGDPVMRARLETPLARIVSTRLTGILERRGITTVNEVLHFTERELRALPSVSSAAIRELLEALGRLGFKRQ